MHGGSDEAVPDCLVSADQQGGPSQPSAGPSQPSGPNQQLSTQQAMHMMKLANMSAEQMRAAGYPENLIRNIEQNRPALQATWRRMQMQRIQAQHQQQQLQLQQGAGLNPSLPFQNQHQTQTVLHSSSPLQTQGGILNANVLSSPGMNAGSSQSNDMPLQQRPQLNSQNMPPQNMQMLGVFSTLQKPNPESIKHALSVIDQMKQDISKERNFRPEHVKHLSDVEKEAFPGQFEALCNVIKDVFKLLHMYLASTNDVDIVRGLLNMYDMCDKQRQLVQSANPIYVLDVATLQGLMKTAVELKTKVLLVMQQLRTMSQAYSQQQIDGRLPPPPAAQQDLSPQDITSPPASVPPRPPCPPTTQSLPPQIPQQNLRVPPTKTPHHVCRLVFNSCIPDLRVCATSTCVCIHYFTCSTACPGKVDALKARLSGKIEVVAFAEIIDGDYTKALKGSSILDQIVTSRKYLFCKCRCCSAPSCSISMVGEHRRILEGARGGALRIL